MRTVRSNSDKPHRCPSCGRISFETLNKGTRWAWTVQHCGYCDLRWCRGLSDDMVFTWIRRPTRKMMRWLGVEPY